jgi:hypothetical protein
MQAGVPFRGQMGDMTGRVVNTGAPDHSSRIAALNQQLQQAMMQGAPPSVINQLQMQLQEAQQAQQAAGMQALYEQRMRQETTGYGGGSVGTGGRGGRESPYESQMRPMNNLNNQMLMSLFGMTGSGPGPNR